MVKKRGSSIEFVAVFALGFALPKPVTTTKES